MIFTTIMVLAIAAVVGLGLTWMTATRGTDIGTLTIGACRHDKPKAEWKLVHCI